MIKNIIFGVRVSQLDSHAHCRIFVNGASAGTITVRKEELPTLLHRFGLEQAGDILSDTEPSIKKQIKKIFDGCDPNVPFELHEFGGWQPLYGNLK